MSDESPLLPEQVFAQRVREIRTRRGWTQQKLAERLSELGLPTDRTTVLKIEKGETTRARNVSLREALAIAAALEVAPVHLIAPLEDDVLVAVTDEHVITAKHLRGWIRAELFLPGGTARGIAAGMPESELRRMFASRIAQAAALTPDERAFVDRRRKAVLGRVADKLGYGVSDAITDAIEHVYDEAAEPQEEEE
jgi:transcriptional regulator with XRE-family HTH domain